NIEVVTFAAEPYGCWIQVAVTDTLSVQGADCLDNGRADRKNGFDVKWCVGGERFQGQCAIEGINQGRSQLGICEHKWLCRTSRSQYPCDLVLTLQPSRAWIGVLGVPKNLYEDG